MLSDEFIKLFNKFVEDYAKQGKGGYVIGSKDRNYDKIVNTLQELTELFKNKEFFEDHQFLIFISTASHLLCDTNPAFHLCTSDFLKGYDRAKPNVISSIGEQLNVKIYPNDPTDNFYFNLLEARAQEKRAHAQEADLILKQIKTDKVLIEKLTEENKLLRSKLERANDIEEKYNKLIEAQELVRKLHGFFGNPASSASPLPMQFSSSSIPIEEPPKPPMSEPPPIPAPQNTAVTIAKTRTQQQFGTFDLDELLKQRDKILQKKQQDSKHTSEQEKKNTTKLL